MWLYVQGLARKEAASECPWSLQLVVPGCRAVRCRAIEVGVSDAECRVEGMGRRVWCVGLQGKKYGL